MNRGGPPWTCTLPYPSNLQPPLAFTGNLYGYTVSNWLKRTVTTIYKETIRDEEPTGGGKIWQYAAHEVGHSTIPPWGVIRSASQEHAEEWLMKDNGLQDSPYHPEQKEFSPATHRRFRGDTTW